MATQEEIKKRLLNLSKDSFMFLCKLTLNLKLYKKTFEQLNTEEKLIFALAVSTLTENEKFSFPYIISFVTHEIELEKSISKTAPEKDLLSDENIH